MDKRYSIQPIQNADLWDLHKKAESSFWTVHEVDLSKDPEHWSRLSEGEKHFIKHVLAFFAGSDGIVNENLAARFINEVPWLEAKAFYAFQQVIENIHNEMYGLLLITYIKDVDERVGLFNAIETIPCIKEKARWAIRWIQDREASFAQRLLAFACVEGIFFSGAFCAIYWFKEKDLLPGLCKSNELISRDESLHTEFAVLMYNEYVPEKDKLSQESVYGMFEEALEIEESFINEAIPCHMIGMSAEQMTQYIRFCADRLLVQLGYAKRWGASNPFSFMERISLDGKTNYFESRPTEYSLANVPRSFPKLS